MRVAIRCQPRAPVATDDVEHWLSSELGRLRAQAPKAILRMQRLTQPAPGGRLEVGWLVVVDVVEEDGLGGEHGLAEVLRDMRLLGLRPTVLHPGATAGREPVADPVDQMCDDSFPASDPPATWTWEVPSKL
jgi:hypothetical protein